MKENLEALEQFAIDVILDRRRGFRAGLLRLFLAALSKLYARGVALRLALFQGRFMHERNLGCMVISVGNLTVGGTGKTPVVEMLARDLQAGGRKVAILSRGYKSDPEAAFEGREMPKKKSEIPVRVVSDGEDLLLNSAAAGDEPYMLAANLRDVVVVVNRDRVKAGIHAIEEFGCDTLVLDDGLQYLKLKHRLNVVLVDRTSPFGNEKILPRGTLREPPKNLKRADYILLTKCDGSDNSELIKRLRKYNRTADIIECRHKPLYLENLLDGTRLPLKRLEGAYVGTISGIAVPESFEKGLRKLGAKIELTRRFADHHRYSDGEVVSFINRALNRDVEMIVTTEKDAVRFPALADADVPVYFLRMEIEILKGQDVWDRAMSRICTPSQREDGDGGFY